MRRSLWTKLQVYNKGARFAKSVTMRSVPSCRSLLVLIGVTAGLAATPEVTKVEPPNWWIGHSINPVRLLIRGHNLAGARAIGGAGVAAGSTRVNGAGTYAFVDVSIAPDAKPGPHALRIVSAGGEARAPFEVLRPLPREGRFQGFSPDDIIYLIMPDRFANGDPSND